jgi:hypothetical protein
MRSAFLVLLSTCAFAAGGPKPLFDGKTLDGWKQCNGSAKYTVADGVLEGTTVKGSPNSFLCTTRNYANFVLELDAKNDPELNSGIQLRSHQYEKETDTVVNNKGMRPRHWPAGRVHGYQVEIANEKSPNNGGIFDEARSGWIGEIKEGSACAKAYHDNQWNHFKVIANGDHLQTWVNGVACADIHDSKDASGFIALQVHEYGGPTPVHVWFKNIRLEELPAH